MKITTASVRRAGWDACSEEQPRWLESPDQMFREREELNFIPEASDNAWEGNQLAYRIV